MTPLFSLSAIRRKFFLCRHAWKNKIMVEFFASMACSMTSIPMDIKQVKAPFKNKPAIEVLNQGPEIIAEAIKAIKEPAQMVQTSKLPVVPAAPSQSAVLIENFLKPALQSFPSSSCNHVVSSRILVKTPKKQAVSAQEHSFRSRKHCLGLTILKMVEESLTRHETILRNTRGQHEVVLKFFHLLSSLEHLHFLSVG
jgi:hypothetical protein